MNKDLRFAEKTLKKGGIGVLPTDTVYGLVGSAILKRTVERIYRVRKRDPKKPLIILIGSFGDLGLFGIKPDARTLKLLKKFWPGPVSIILPCPGERFYYLHRGTKTLAFRLPRAKRLRQLIKKTGPLVAPSANLGGRPLAKTISEAAKYFGAGVDFYIDGGVHRSKPSSLIEIKR